MCYLCIYQIITNLIMKDIISSSDTKRVLVIGNGFDLDLGWNTRFSDFTKSKYWPQALSPILRYLRQGLNQDTWFDVEVQLGEYASERTPKSRQIICNDILGFNLLVEGFTKYLLDEVSKPIKSDSVAAEVFSEILRNQNFTSIYSFNYTDLYYIAERLDIKSKFQYVHMHGSLKDNIIIGAPEFKQLHKGYEFLYKTFNANYRSTELIYDLREAKEVVFFGHSLGTTDYHYFQSFFKEQCNDQLKRSDAKKITIFTYDDNSRISIMSQLRAMNENKTNLLFHLNDFSVIMTSANKRESLDEYITHLRKTSLAEHQQQIDRLLSKL